MPMSSFTVTGHQPPEVVAGFLSRAERERRPIPVGSSPLTMTAAYGWAVQAAGYARADAVGAGYKIGLSSAGPQQRFGVTEPIWGLLFDRHVQRSDEVSSDAFIAPRLEPEIAVTVDATGALRVAPAIEIVDSRWQPGAASLGHLLADNISAAGVVLGAWRPVDGLDVAGLTVTLSVGGAVTTGRADAVLGDPLRAFRWLVGDLAARGAALAPGQFVITGSWCAPVPVHAGDVVEADFGPLGRCSTVFSQ